MTWSSKPRVVVDTNVFISGLLFGGNPEKVLNAIKDQRLELVISPSIELEILQKMVKFKIARRHIFAWKKLLESTSILVAPPVEPQISRDAKDNKFLAAADMSKAEFLVTGDKDLLTLHSFKQTVIVSPKQFLTIFATQQPRHNQNPFQ